MEITQEELDIIKQLRKIIKNQNAEARSLFRKLKQMQKEQNIKAIEELKQAKQDVNNEANIDGYVDAVWFDRYIDNEIDKLEAEGA